ncbi:unnamed protein product [Urochloa humidicola]
MASGIGASDASASSTVGGSAGAVPAAGNNSSRASQILAAARVFPPHDNERKPLWRYVELLENTGKGDGGNKKSRCRLCNFIINGSYSRVKAHLLKVPGYSVRFCPEASDQVLAQLNDEIAKAEVISARKLPRDIPLPGEGISRKRKISAIESSFNLETRSQLDALIARMFYTAGLPFNLARNPYFRKAFIFAANNALGGYAPPSYNKLRTTLLVQEKTNVERLLQPIKSTWSSKGVSVVSDGWSDVQRRPLLNFLAVTEDGPMFLRAINTEGEVKRKEYIAEKMLAVIEEIGSQNVVQVITDNAANCRGAGLIVEQKHPHIFWTPCVVHTLNLGLKNICAARDIDDELHEEFNWISEVAGDASAIKSFIMSHSMRLSMFNDFSKLKFLAIADTRFASIVVMLKRLRAIKESLVLMVVSEKWNTYRDDNVGQAQFVKEKVLNDVWWDKVSYILDFTEPIYSMIRAADTDKPCLHLIYEMWDTMIEKVKKTIYRHEGKEPHEESTFYFTINEILVSRWAKSNTPLHCLAHSLNPKYYSEVWINEIPNRQAPHMDEEISDMRNICFRRFFSGEELRKIKQQFADFSLFGNGFNSYDSIEDRIHLEAKQWWGIHGNSAPELKRLAFRLLGQPTSSSCAERNWSTYGLIHSSIRNRLNPGRAEDLVFAHQNLRLLSRKTEEYNQGPSAMWDVGGDTFEFDLDGGADFLQQAQLSLDEPNLERILDDMGALDLSAGPPPPSNN